MSAENIDLYESGSDEEPPRHFYLAQDTAAQVLSPLFDSVYYCMLLISHLVARSRNLLLLRLLLLLLRHNMLPMKVLLCGVMRCHRGLPPRRLIWQKRILSLPSSSSPLRPSHGHPGHSMVRQFSRRITSHTTTSHRFALFCDRPFLHPDSSLLGLPLLFPPLVLFCHPTTWNSRPLRYHLIVVIV